MKISFIDLKKFYQNKNVLITGHTGFKGGWLSLFLKHLNSNTLGISLERLDASVKSGFDKRLISQEILVDINDVNRYRDQLINFKPEIIFYLAAQPFVRKAFLDPIQTFNYNVNGLIKFLDLIRFVRHAKFIVIVTSDKVYEQTDLGVNYTENDRLGGIEPYGVSKAMQEMVSKCFFESYLKDRTSLITVRAGNVLGGGDFGKDRLIVDIIESIKSKKKMSVRFPHNTRPWQYILDLIYGYLCTVIEIGKSKNTFDSFNFAANKSHSVLEILDFATKYWGNSFRYEINESNNNIYEQKNLSINSNKIKNLIEWRTKNDLSEILLPTFKWYKSFIENKDMRKINDDMVQNFFKVK